MLSIDIPAMELFNEDTNEFYNIKATTLKLEHSLISISKWESKYCKPFIGEEPKNIDETLYYIKCMTINSVDPNIYSCITNEDVDKINAYIDAPMTATKVYNLKKNSGPKRKTMTSEYIYSLMILAGVPFECEKWHINRLIALIETLAANNPNAPKMKGRELLEYNHLENQRRLKALGTRG